MFYAVDGNGKITELSLVKRTMDPTEIEIIEAILFPFKLDKVYVFDTEFPLPYIGHYFKRKYYVLGHIFAEIFEAVGEVDLDSIGNSEECSNC